MATEEQTMPQTAKPGQINHATVDRFTLGHVAIGVIMGLVNVPPTWAWAVAIGWELLERPLKKNIPEIFPHPEQDTLPNAIGDIAAMLIGYNAIRALPPI